MSTDLVFKQGIPFNKDGFLLFSTKMLNQSVNYFNEKGYNKAIFSSYGSIDEKYSETSLDVLKQINTKELIIIFYGNLNCAALNTQHDLMRLEITSDPVSEEIDFVNFPALQIFKGYWTKKLVNLFSCKSVKQLTLWKYQSNSKDLSEVAGLENLESLTLNQSNLNNLAGFERLKSLKNLSLAYNKALEFFNVDTNVSLPLEELEIEVCKKLDIQSIRGLPYLKRLDLLNNGKYETLQPLLDKLPVLEDLNFSQTDLLNGDNSYLLKYSKLKKIFFLDKRHYKFSCDQINEALQDEATRKKLLSQN